MPIKWIWLPDHTVLSVSKKTPRQKGSFSSGRRMDVLSLSIVKRASHGLPLAR